MRCYGTNYLVTCNQVVGLSGGRIDSLELRRLGRPPRAQASTRDPMLTTREPAPRRPTLAILAWWFQIAGILLPTILASRVMTTVGPISTVYPRVFLVADALVYGSAILAVFSLLMTRGERKPSLLLVLGLWGFVTARFASDIQHGQGVDFNFALWVLVVQSTISASLNHNTVWKQVIGAGRMVMALSIASLAFPSWSVMPLEWSGRSIAGIGRMTGVTSHPNTLALIALTMLVVELFGRGILKHRLLYGTFAAICLLLAQSSTTYIAGTAVVLWWIVVKTRKYWPLVTTALLFAISFAVALGLPSYILNSFDQERLETGSGRTIIWDYATRPLFPDNWLLGFGSQFLDAGYRLRYLPPNQQQAVHAHNQFVQAFGEGGLIGLVCFLILVSVLISIAVKSFAFDNGMRSALIVTFLASMMTEVMVRAGGTPGIGGLLFLALISGGTTALGHRNRDESKHPVTEVRAIPRGRVPR